ncbi:MAG TPA: SH3 domain-containing protein [Arsenicitalea sp.]|nr:SH3 domain-containing protein [Arsenicitalea sp.]
MLERLARTPGRLSIELAAGAAIALAFIWIAGFAQPAKCAGPTQGGQCLANGAAADAARQRRLVVKTVAPAVAATPVPLAATAPAPQPPAEARPAAQGLIAATFERLQVPPDNRKSAPATVIKASETDPAPGARADGPTARLVATTVIRADVTQDGSLHTAAAAIAPSPAVVPAVLPPAAPIPALRTALVAPPPAPTAQRPQSAPAGTDVRLVGGAGVTVRSGPSKSNPRLFALAAGQKVTIAGNQKGWLQIVDAKGRRGWAYSSFFATP